MDSQSSVVVMLIGAAAILFSIFLLTRTSTKSGFRLCMVGGCAGLVIGLTILAGKALERPRIQIVLPERPALLKTGDIIAETRLLSESYRQAADSCEINYTPPPPVVMEDNSRGESDSRREPLEFVDALRDRQARCEETARTFDAMQPPPSASPDMAASFRRAFRICRDTYAAGAALIGQAVEVELNPANRTLNVAVRSSAEYSQGLSRECETAWRAASANAVDL